MGIFVSEINKIKEFLSKYQDFTEFIMQSLGNEFYFDSPLVIQIESDYEEKNK